jgi:predicted O-methyltransferase YrrM
MSDMRKTLEVTASAGATIPWATIDADTERVLAELEAREANEKALVASLPPDVAGLRRDEFLLSVGRAAGTLLDLLARESHAHRILELGTSRGYSTIWLAHAARATGSSVLSIDVDAGKQAFARAALERANLDEVVQFHTGEALDFLASTHDTYDFVLLDLWKDVYVPCLDALLPRLRPGATVIADNMIEPPVGRASAVRYLEHVSTIAELQTVVLPVGNGLAVSRYQVTMPES